MKKFERGKGVKENLKLGAEAICIHIDHLYIKGAMKLHSISPEHPYEVEHLFQKLDDFIAETYLEDIWFVYNYDRIRDFYIGQDQESGPYKEILENYKGKWIKYKGGKKFYIPSDKEAELIQKERREAYI